DGFRLVYSTRRTALSDHSGQQQKDYVSPPTHIKSATKVQRFFDMCKELPYFLITFPKNTTGGKGQKKEKQG
ncbi:MAG: hypothetical protein SPF23_02575, partial [Paludibacteraceae bacterium]|nr:hypothetical protein [Paludibacteraceae bacterium]